MILPVQLKQNGYDIVLERGVLHRAGQELTLDRKVLIVTDSGVPAVYSETVAKQAKTAEIVTVDQGEGSKSVAVWERLCRTLLEKGFSRGDCVVAVGGGVVGDLAGFVAASFMRGIDFYNIPTTLLSQVDSSIGGKVAINFEKIKNIIGAFYQPKKVLIDPELLKTLPARQISAGLAEALKMGLCFDKSLVEIFAKDNPIEKVDLVIEKSLRIKARVVEEDEKEKGLRKVLNFGHTIGHGVESAQKPGEFLHGECVAIGMLPMCSKEIRSELLPIYKKLSLPSEIHGDIEKIWQAMLHDKKSCENGMDVSFVEEIGSFKLERISLQALRKRLEEGMKA